MADSISSATLRLVGLSSATRMRRPPGSASSASTTSVSIATGGSASDSAISTVKVAPLPGRPWALMLPPISSTSCRQMARPMPTPPNRRVNEESPCSKRRNSRSASSGSKPMPVSDTSSS